MTVNGVARQIARMIRSGATPVSIFRVRSNVSQKYLIIQMRRATLESGEPIIIAATFDLRWPDGFKALLGEAFDSSAAEAEVVRLLINAAASKKSRKRGGGLLMRCARRSKRSFPKIETTSQVELVRLVLSMMDMAAITFAADAKPTAIRSVDGGLEALPITRLPPMMAASSIVSYWVIPRDSQSCLSPLNMVSFADPPAQSGRPSGAG